MTNIAKCVKVGLFRNGLLFVVFVCIYSTSIWVHGEVFY